MLRDLHVRDLAVLADVSVCFEPGLNVLSGETGAGKSLIVDSLALLAGARASSELIRTGAEQLSVTGVFEPVGEGWRRLLSEAGVASEEGAEEVVVRREIARSGRNRVFVNDQPVTLRLLTELAPSLLRIHTQGEELGLFSPELQRRWLDTSGGEQAERALESAAERFETYDRAARRLRRSEGGERLRRERLDLLRFQIAEIDAARLVAGEDEELRREREILRHSETVLEALGGSYGLLAEEDGAAVDRLHRSERLLGQIAEWEGESEAWVAELQEIRIRLEELARAVRSRLDRVDADPGRLDAIEERLATVERLGRKYGGGSTEVLAYRDRIGRELEELEGEDQSRDQLEAQAKAALARYREAAEKLSGDRREWGRRLAERVHAELADLAMAKARFAVELTRRASGDSPLELDGEPVEFSAAGYDHVVFQLAANPGEEAQPLSRVASGGELSRVYLALQLAVLAERGDPQPTLVFDEVDSGIGGAEAAALGRKLERLSNCGQILVVTHLPQVASFAHRQFRVRKRVRDDRTRMMVDSLDESARVEEVARMLAGSKITDLSRSHARELIEAAGRAR